MKPAAPLLAACAAVTPCLAISLPAAAQNVTVLQDGARYAMRATPDGTLRLNTMTGETTLCTTAGGRLSCTVSADEREAYEAEIDALDSRLRRLEQRLATLETVAEDAVNEGGDMGGNHPSRHLPRADPVSRAASLANRAMRGFVGAVKRLRRDLVGS